MKKTVLALVAAVFILSVGVGTADAAWTQGFTTVKKIMANAKSATLAAHTTSVDVVYTLAAGEQLNTNDTLTITLGGNAKFSTTLPTVTASSGALSIVGSPIGLTTANFRVDNQALVGDALRFNTTAAIFDLSSADSSVTFTARAVTGGGLEIFNKATTQKVGSTVAFSAQNAPSVVTITAASNVADVSAAAGAFKAFTAATNVPVFTFYNVVNGGNTAPVSSPVPAGSVVFGITGDLTGISQINAAAGNITGSDSAGVQGTGIANRFLKSGTTAAYAFNTNPAGPEGLIAASPTFVLDGSTAQTARSFNANARVLADATYWNAYVAKADTLLYSITRNGSSFVSNSVGPRNTIKITDRSGGIGTAGGAITITAYDVNGTALTEVAGAPALTIQNKATTTITGTDLIARYSTTPMRYDFSVESSNIVVTNVKVSTDATTTSTTVYTAAGDAL